MPAIGLNPAGPNAKAGDILFDIICPWAKKPSYRISETLLLRFSLSTRESNSDELSVISACVQSGMNSTEMFVDFGTCAANVVDIELGVACSDRHLLFGPKGRIVDGEPHDTVNLAQN